MLMIIEYHKRAKKFITSQEEKTALRLYKAIEKLPDGDVTKLKGMKNKTLSRLRVGDFRVIFHMEQDLILILKIDNRGEVYK